ncbi:MAG: hypothetical protein ACI9T8_000536 [Candidatus Saccharimonadales bacterium]|jgi:hypothetical protein
MVNRQSQRGFISVVFAIVFAVLFVVSTVLAMLANSSKEDYKNNVDQKVEAAVVIAVQEAESAKDVEFIEKEKSPVRTYTGSATYGSLIFEYPKTWSVYVEENSSGTVLDLYAHPGAVPDTTSKQPYALRAQITSTAYDTEAATITRAVEKGELSSAAFRPAKVQEALGLKATGSISRDVQGSLVLLPLRDRSILLFTESTEYLSDFNNIIVPSITFTP